MVSLNLDNYRQVFRHKPFRYFWVGFALSGIGDAMTRVALTWYVWDTTHSSQALGLLTFLYMAPIILGGLLAGWLLDRFGRRNVMVVDNFARGVIVVFVPLINAFGLLEIWHVYVVAALYGSLMMISLAGAPSLIPALVTRDHLSTANALETLGFTVSQAIGPMVAGFLIAIISAPNVLIIDAISYFVFALALSRIRFTTEARSATHQATQTYQLQDAFRLLIYNKVLLSTTLMYMAFNFGLGMMFVWLPIYADETLGGGSQLYGTLLGLLAAGSVVSSVVAGSLTLSMSYGTLISLILIFAGLSLGVLSLAQGVWTTAIGVTMFGVFTAPLTIWAQTLRMRIIPEPLRGRTFALLRMLMQSANPLGGASAGPLLPAMGILSIIALSAVFVGVPGVIGLRLRKLRAAQGLNQ